MFFKVKEVREFGKSFFPFPSLSKKIYNFIFRKVTRIGIITNKSNLNNYIWLREFSYNLESIFGITSMPSNAGNASIMLSASQDSGISSDSLEMIAAFINLPLTNILIAFLFYFLGGYLLYSSIFAAIGAAVDNQTDAQQFLMPITIVLIVALYAGILTVPEDPNGIVAQIFSFIPLTSPIVMMMRIPHGVPIFEQIISITILFLSVILIIWIAAKIYRIGILMYGKKPSYKELIKWLKY